MEKKYEFTGETKEFLGKTLHRIRALVDIGKDVKAGNLGGWIESEDNLSQEGDAWVTGQATVTGRATVTGQARVCGEYDHIVIGPMGSRNDYTTFCRAKDGSTIVACGCFRGYIDEFEAAVKKTHGDNEHGKAYMAAIQFVKTVINTEAVEDD